MNEAFIASNMRGQLRLTPENLWTFSDSYRSRLCQHQKTRVDSQGPSQYSTNCTQVIVEHSRNESQIDSLCDTIIQMTYKSQVMGHGTVKCEVLELGNNQYFLHSVQECHVR